MTSTLGNNLDIDDSVVLGEGVVLRDNVHLRHVIVGAGTKIGRNAIIFGTAQNPVRIGAGCYISPNCFINGAAGLELGDDVTLAPGVNISTDSGPNAGPLKQYYPLEALRITIGSGAWIGAAAVLLPGAAMGLASVLGANSMLKTPIGAYEVYAGSPARLIKQIHVQK